jgi:hypothetical protein
MNAQTPVDHHFVPIFYLKAWAVDGRVERYSRPRDIVVAKSNSPKRTGSEAHLYTLRGVAPERQAAIETQFFQPVDDKAAVAHRILLAGGLKALTLLQRIEWARFMMSMQYRSPWSLGELARLCDKIMRENMGGGEAGFDEMRKPGDPETMYEWFLKYRPETIANFHKITLPSVIDSENMGKYLVNMIWSTVDLSGSKFSLLTGDRPLVHSHGWKHPDTTLAFPLSPTMVLFANNRHERTQDILSTPAVRLVKQVNEHIVRCAVDFVVGRDKSHLAFVEKRLRRPGEEPVPGPGGRGRPGCPE